MSPGRSQARGIIYKTSTLPASRKVSKLSEIVEVLLNRRYVRDVGRVDDEGEGGAAISMKGDGCERRH